MGIYRGVVAEEPHRRKHVLVEWPICLALTGAVSAEVQGEDREAPSASLATELLVSRSPTPGAVTDDQPGSAAATGALAEDEVGDMSVAERGVGWARRQVEVCSELETGQKALLKGGEQAHEFWAHRQSSEQGRLIRSQSEIGDIGQIAERLAIVEAVSDEKVVGHFKAAVADFDVHESLVGPVEEGADLQ